MSTGFKKIVAALLAIALIAYTVKRLLFNPMDLLAAHRPPPATVQAIVVKSEPMPIILEAVGTLRAKHQVTLAPEIPGRVKELPYASGETVKKGDVIVLLDYRVEEADLQKAKAQLALADVSLKRAQNLVLKNVESQSILDQKKADFKQAEAVVALSETHVQQKKICAPFDGDLGIFENKINVGHYVQPGEALITLSQRDHLYVNFSTDEKTRDTVKVGQKVSITTDGEDATVHEGTITSIDPQIKEQTRGIMLQASINNSNLVLFPGMYAHVKVAVRTEPKAIIIPETAINFTLYGASVFLIQKNDKGQHVVKRQLIEIGQRLRNAVNVVNGLKENDFIVNIGHAKLNEGDSIIIDKENTLPELLNLKS